MSAGSSTPADANLSYNYFYFAMKSVEVHLGEFLLENVSLLLHSFQKQVGREVTQNDDMRIHTLGMNSEGQ